MEKQMRQEAVCRILFFLLACAAVIFAGLFLGTAGASDLGRLDVYENHRLPTGPYIDHTADRLSCWNSGTTHL